MAKKKVTKKVIKKAVDALVKSHNSVKLNEQRRLLPRKVDKINLAAQTAAIEFLNNISAGYDQDSTPRFEHISDKLKFLDTPEDIPVVSDTNVDQLKQLLVKFYNRNVTLELK